VGRGDRRGRAGDTRFDVERSHWLWHGGAALGGTPFPVFLREHPHIRHRHLTPLKPEAGQAQLRRKLMRPTQLTEERRFSISAPLQPCVELAWSLRKGSTPPSIGVSFLQRYFRARYVATGTNDIHATLDWFLLE